MIEFLIGSAKNMFPFYLLAFVICQALLLLKEKNGFIVETIVALIICVTLSLFALLIETNSWALENKLAPLVLVSFICTLVPLTIFIVANQALARIEKVVIKHASLLGVVTITMLVWPLFVVYVTCATGLDCL